MSKALEAARAAMRAKMDSGEGLERLDPIEKHLRSPSSLRLAINAKCFDCVGRDGDPNWRGRVSECSCTHCPLHSVRPYQRSQETPSSLDMYEAGKREIVATAQTSAEYEARIADLAAKCGV